MTFVGDDGVDGGGHCRDGSFRTCSGGGPTGVLGGGTPIDGARAPSCDKGEDHPWARCQMRTEKELLLGLLLGLRRFLSDELGLVAVFRFACGCLPRSPWSWCRLSQRLFLPCFKYWISCSILSSISCCFAIVIPRSTSALSSCAARRRQ